MRRATTLTRLLTRAGALGAALVVGLGVSRAAETDKTLVAWVTVTDPQVRGGSVVSVQAGDAYDGLVFGEVAPARWMTGSDFLKRTMRSQAACPAETAGPDAVLQMAAVYEGDRITIYRDGKVYAEQRAAGEKLLGRDDAFVVFGQRQVPTYGGDFAGTIDDARIYDRALTAAELGALAPNAASEIQPWAWWDFEDGRALDRTGRFPDTRLLGAARVAGGQLLLGVAAGMVAGKPFQPTTPAWPQDPPADWVTFHLAHPGPGSAVPGDPNAALFHGDRCHLHYIVDQPGYSYAHVSSDDMVHWTWHPTVLTARTTGHGLFSGTGFLTKEGRPAAIYCGPGSGRNWVAVALDDTLDRWGPPVPVLPRDAAGKPVDIVTGFPGGRGPHYAPGAWDPDCWLMDDTYHAVSGGVDPHLMTSPDLTHWLAKGRLLHDDFPAELGVSRGEDISCPNMFRIGDKWMLLCISHHLGCRYYLGNFRDGKYRPDFHALMSWNGAHVFAPESVRTPDGRRVMWAWLRGLPVAPTGVQSLPRELELPEDGVLRIRPLRELATLRRDPKTAAGLVIKAGATLPLEIATGAATEIELSVPPCAAPSYGLDVLCDAGGAGGLRIALDAEAKVLRVGTVQAPFTLAAGEPLRLRVFVDKNLVEVFANDRQAAVAAQRHDPARIHARLFAEGGDVVVERAEAWRLAPALRADR